MLRITLAGLRAHKLRMVATLLAIVLGVGFVAGTLIFGDTAKAALFDEFARSARNVDVVVKASGRELPLSLPQTLRGVTGVAAAEGRMSRLLPLIDRTGRIVTDSGGTPGQGVSAGTVAGLREYDVTSGRAPAAGGEAAIDAETAEKTRYAVGDTITVLDGEQQKRTLKLVGIVSFGTSARYASTAVVVVLPQADLAALTGEKGYREVVVHAAPGVDPADLSSRLSAALPPDSQLISGAKQRRDLANEAIGQVDNFVTGLQLFAWIAVGVSAFVIYNTFNILIAQRVREMALLRCVGAGRSQLFRSVLIEAAVVGLVGAAAGIAVGVLVAYALFSGQALLGTPLPSHAPVITATPVVVALVIGLVVTVLSALLPAIRATRVAPLAALRTAATARTGGIGRRVLLVVTAGVVAAGGTALTLAGVNMKKGDDAVMAVVAGGAINFLAVLIAAPLFVGPLTALLGWLPGRVFGPPAKLASANARRNPGRTAATTAALMIGVGLMSASSVLVNSVEASATAELTENYPVDYILQPASLQAIPLDGSDPFPTETPAEQQRGVPTGVADRLRADRTFAGVARIRLVRATVDDGIMDVGAVDPQGIGLAKPKALNGSMDALRPGTIGLDHKIGKAMGKTVGDQVTVTAENGGPTRTFTVVALYSRVAETGAAMITWDDSAALQKPTDDALVLVRAADGTSPQRSRERLDAALVDYPLVAVLSIADWRDKITGSVTQIIGVIAALLGFAIVIALIGIMNTLSLSVFERTRESAMVRALGLTRGQLRGTLLIEALLMALIGAIVGVCFGVVYGLTTTKVMFGSETSLILRVPALELVGYVALAALAGVAAAVLPARRAARTSIVSAMADE